ncbi:hypothetical protein [Mycobacterium sp. SMC-4]|uniref:WXG100-like domain-containing protein n=1 Tax=Mycobacterium sp. SMC-4 TaxID=2857059 RepID=UPI003D07916D
MRIEVEPDALIGAGQRMGSLGSQLRMLSDALGAALGGGIASGLDPAGVNFGMKYGRQAQEFANAIADAANAFTSVGLLLEATGYNYKNADAASTIGGPGPSGGVSGEPGKAEQAHVPMGPNGSIVPPPAKWHLVQPLLQALPGVGMFAGAAMTWPSGNAALMRLTATQWRNFSNGFAAIEPQLTGIKAAVQAQSIPEGATILSALDNLGQAISSLGEAASSVAQSVSDFATGVQDTQDAIRRLLDRLSIGGLWDTVTGFLTGEGDDILREVARDVGTVLDNFQQQVKGIVGLLEELVIVIGDAATAFQKWIRPVLVEHFGEGVGGFLADVVKVRTDFSVGAVTGLINTVSGVVALADADTWKGMAELAASVAQDPTTLPGVLANMGKEFVAWDKWSGDHPGRAAGEAAFNIGSLFVPGGALTKTGSVAKSLSLSRRVLEEGRLPQLGEVGSWTRGTPNVGAPPRLPEVPPVRPGPTPPLSRPDTPAGAGPGRVGESAPSSPGAGPSRPSTDGGAGQRAPVEQPGRGSDASAPRPEPSRAPESGTPSPTQSNGQAAPSAVEPQSTLPAPVGDGSGQQSSSPPGGPDTPDSGNPSGHHPGSAEPGPSDGDGHTPNANGEPPEDGSRVYTMADGSSHTTSFAPEQLLDNQRVDDALAAHGVSKSDFVDLINRPIDTLTPDERQLINAVRDELPAPNRDTVMQKVIPPGYFDVDGNFVQSRADDYLMDGNSTVPDRVGGAVTIAGDTAHLGTPASIYDGLRLDYSESPFERHDPGTHIIRFQADLASNEGIYEVPRHSAMGGDGSYDTWDDPFTGNGFTKSGSDAIPEYVAKDVTMREGAEMWEVLEDGTQRLVAVLGGDTWILQGNS